MKICALLILDHPEEAVVTARKLDASGLEIAEVLVASDLATAREIIQRNNLDVVLMDVNLGADRFPATLNIIRAETQAAVVVLTDLDDEQLGIEAIRMGADDYLVKGLVTKQQLRASVVHSTLRRKAIVLAKNVCQKTNNLISLVESSVK